MNPARCGVCVIKLVVSVLQFFSLIAPPLTVFFCDRQASSEITRDVAALFAVAHTHAWRMHNAHYRAAPSTPSCARCVSWLEKVSTAKLYLARGWAQSAAKWGHLHFPLAAAEASTYTFCLIKFQKITLLAFKMSLLRFPQAGDRYEELTWLKKKCHLGPTLLDSLKTVLQINEKYIYQPLIAFKDQIKEALLVCNDEDQKEVSSFSH